MPQTAKRYDSVLKKFEAWLWQEHGLQLEQLMENGIVVCVGVAREFVRVAFKKHLLSGHEASTFCASLKRFLMFYQLQGLEPQVDVTVILKPLWKLRRSWFNEIPCEFRCPVNLEIALSLCVFFLLSGQRRMCLLTLLGFHCLLRPGEARAVRFDQFHFFRGMQRNVYRGVPGLVSIERPKTRRMAQHAPLQAVTLEDETIANWIECLLLLVPGPVRRSCIWPGAEHLARKAWRHGLRHLGLGGLRLTMAGLRGGGAVHHSLILQNIPVLRRRGRWSNETTLERYLQEALFSMSALNVSAPVQAKIGKLGTLASQVFMEDCARLQAGPNLGLEMVESSNDLIEVSSSSDDDDIVYDDDH